MLWELRTKIDIVWEGDNLGRRWSGKVPLERMAKDECEFAMRRSRGQAFQMEGGVCVRMQW